MEQQPVNKSIELVRKPNHLTLILTGSDPKNELYASIALLDIQKLSDSHGDDAVKNCIHGIFKQLIEKLKKN
jgi:hypothetical protein